MEVLTERQQRELEYHRGHAELYRQLLSQPFSWDVIENPKRRWWNAYWRTYDFLLSCDLKGKSVLVVGCGFGHDALRIAKLGAKVCAFDLSPESLEIAKALAEREQLSVEFDQMPAERMRYEDSSFDYIVAIDILHHVDVPATMMELIRVAKPDAVLVVDEIYSHSMTETVRRSAFVDRFLYPKMQRLIYGPGRPYITEDERKLNESDVREISRHLGDRLLNTHFNFLVTRIVSDRSDLPAKLDQVLLRLLKPVAHLLAGRVLFCAPIRKLGSRRT